MTRKTFYNVTLLSVYPPPACFAKLPYCSYHIKTTYVQNLQLLIYTHVHLKHIMGF